MMERRSPFAGVGEPMIEHEPDDEVLSARCVCGRPEAGRGCSGDGGPWMSEVRLTSLSMRSIILSPTCSR